MRAKKALGVLLLIGMMLCLAGQPAMAVFGKETTGGSFLDSFVIKTAEGQMSEGTIDVVYIVDPLETPCEVGDPNDLQATMITTLRMVRGNTVHPFASTDPVCLFDAQGQADVVKSFITYTVVPTVFPDNTNPANWALKEIRNYVTNDPALPGSMGAEFLMMDITIAVPVRKK